MIIASLLGKGKGFYLETRNYFSLSWKPFLFHSKNVVVSGYSKYLTTYGLQTGHPSKN